MPNVGTLDQVPLAELLPYLEEVQGEGEVSFDTPLGRALIWFRDGCLLDAEMGDATGEAAIFRLLGATRGDYAIQRKLVARLRMIHESALALLGRRARRTADWQRLVAEMPSLDTVLSLDQRRFEAIRAKVPPGDLRLLGLVDGHRTIVEIVDESGFDAVAAVERLAWYVRARLVRVPRASSAPPPPPDVLAASIEPGVSLAQPLPPADLVIPSLGSETPATPVRLSPDEESGVRGSEPPPSEDFATPERRSGEAPRGSSIVPAPMVPLGPPAVKAVSRARRSFSPARTQIGLRPPEPGASPPPGSRRPRPRSTPPLLPSHEESGAHLAEHAPPKPKSVPPLGAERNAAPLVSASTPPPPDALLEQGSSQASERTVLGRYEILSRIARGGMGTVYLCRVTGEGGFRRLFALKVLRRHLARDPVAAEMFLREAQVASGIYDPHVVGIVDVGTFSGQPYIVMDYVEGGSFHQLLERHPTYRPPRLIIPILVDALCGLHAAHTLTGEDGLPLGLVHCDVSPHNLLIGVDGGGRLSDFGISKAVAAAGQGQSIATRGKPGYLAPEQAAHRPVDSRADIFAAGVMLWNALTGQRLFDGPTPEETMESVLTRPIPPPSTVGLRPPPCLDPICMKALARDPASRYQTAELMMRDLRAVALREDLFAPPSDVAKWVVGTFGPELQARRLAALDASRRGRGADIQRVLPEADRLSEPPPPLLLAEGPPSSGPPSREEYSRTVVLKPTDAGVPEELRNRVLMAAAVVSFIAVVLALLFPQGLSRLFSLESDRKGPMPDPSAFSRGGLSPRLPSQASAAASAPAAGPGSGGSAAR